MKKSDLIEKVSAATGTTKAQVEAVIESFFDTVRASVAKDEDVRWPGFGSFSLSQRAARTGRNPQTGETLKIKASKSMRFTPSLALKDYLKAPKRAGVGTKAGAGTKAAPPKKAATKKA